MHCGEVLPAFTHGNALFCNAACRNRAYRVRHPERTRDAVKTWRVGNKDASKAINRRSAARCRIADVRIAMLAAAKARAKKQGLLFNLVLEDLGPLPEYCPVLGIPLELGTGHFCDGSPSLDKVIPALGYTKGNVIIISWRANRIKNNATIHELQALASFYTNLVSSGAFMLPPAR